MKTTPPERIFIVAKNAFPGNYWPWEVRNGRGVVINSFHLKSTAVKARKAFEAHHTQEK